MNVFSLSLYSHSLCLSLSLYLVLVIYHENIERNRQARQSQHPFIHESARKQVSSTALLNMAREPSDSMSLPKGMFGARTRSVNSIDNYINT